MKSFSEITLPSTLAKALEAMSFDTPTPIQAQSIPLSLEGKDVIGCAQTGTGKTGAFCIPVFTRLLASPNGIALVLVPTRELALQIEDFWRKLTRFTPNMGSATLIGGTAMSPQVRSLRRRPRLIIATPGRLLDHLSQRTLSLAPTEFLVLDEADRMLDMGFQPQLDRILKVLPKNRQTLLFTATWAPVMDQLSAKYLRAPVRVTVGSVSKAAPKIAQDAVSTTQKLKNEMLLDILNATPGSVLIFARTQVRTDRVARYLSEYGMDVSRIHGGRSQGQRNAALNGFKSGKVRILVATDIASRGIDVADISHVINYDLPQVPEDYIHRIGRTARAGASGKATSLVTPEERDQWRDISMLLKKSGSEVPMLRKQGEASPQTTKAPQQAVPAARVITEAKAPLAAVALQSPVRPLVRANPRGA